MAHSNITVVTSIMGDKDELIHAQTKGKATFLAFTDLTPSPTWQLKKGFDKFKDPRRNSRIHKILIHQYVSTKYSIWIDGNVQLIEAPEVLIQRYLNDTDIAIFKHPKRDCIYDEAIKCSVKGLDDVETIITQAKTYEDAGYAKHKGLGENRIIFRRHTPQIEAFNNAWWSEYCRHSCRDQISFMYAADSVGIRVKIIPELYVSVDLMTGELPNVARVFTHKTI